MRHYRLIVGGVFLLVFIILSPGVNARTGRYDVCEKSTCFQYKALRGPDIPWQGWNIHVGGQVAADAVAYDEDNRKGGGLRWETLNLRFSADYDNWFQVYIEPDLLGIDTKDNLYQAWVGWRPSPGLMIRAGQVKVALNTEFATRPENFPAIDYGFSSYLDGRYDIGFQTDGFTAGRSLWFQGSVTSGAGFDLDGHRKSNPQYALRTVVFPARLTGRPFLENGFIGLALAWNPDFDDEVRLQTPVRNTVFSTPDLDGDSARWIHVEAGWYGGPLRLGAERVNGAVFDVKTPDDGRQDFDQLTSWSAYISWSLTGQRVRWQRGEWLAPRPINNPPDRFLNLPGCLELAFRYANADIDRLFFDTGLTTYTVSTQEVRTETLNLNWYPRPGVKVSAGWVHTIADHELRTYSHTNRDTAYLLRTNLVF